MQQRLSVEADRSQIFGLQIIGGQKRLDGFGMRVVDQLLGLGDDVRPRRAFSHVRRRRGGAAK